MFFRFLLVFFMILISSSSFRAIAASNTGPGAEPICTQGGTCPTDTSPIVVSEAKACPMGNRNRCASNLGPIHVDYVQMECDFASGLVDCMAWPTGTGLTYQWSTSGMLSLNYTPSPGDSAVSFQCLASRGGKVFLTVTTAFGHSTSIEQDVSCHETIEQ